MSLRDLGRLHGHPDPDPNACLECGRSCPCDTDDTEKTE